jgi:hypothetical protein
VYQNTPSTAVQQDLDQSPEESKAIAEVEEGKHQSAFNLFAKLTSLPFTIYVMNVHLSFRSLFETLYA